MSTLLNNNNSSLDTKDFFEGVFKSRQTLIVSLVISILGEIVSVLLLYSIIFGLKKMVLMQKELY